MLSERRLNPQSVLPQRKGWEMVRSQIQTLLHTQMPGSLNESLFANPHSAIAAITGFKV
ncbi:hypothetical protein [Tardiphaga sp.]|jgi:hypothetical protein|uniref:hypothetical protein n=1 Tax=Tardiphaga sp. TaxID=1926292 RepID=UPI002625B3AD|nr:hypothetical protein [Tardiphaga sp.]